MVTLNHFIVCVCVCMVNGLHIYSTFTDPKATKALYILPHIDPFTHSLRIHLRCQPWKETSSSFWSPQGDQLI